MHTLKVHKLLLQSTPNVSNFCIDIQHEDLKLSVLSSIKLKIVVAMKHDNIAFAITRPW